MPNKSHKKNSPKKSPKKPIAESKKNTAKTWEPENKADRDYDDSIESPRSKNR